MFHDNGGLEIFGNPGNVISMALVDIYSLLIEENTIIKYKSYGLLCCLITRLNYLGKD